MGPAHESLRVQKAHLALDGIAAGGIVDVSSDSTVEADSVPDGDSRLVYSSDGSQATGRVRAEPTARRKASRPAARPALTVPDDGVVRIHRGKHGRGGKAVTSITGLPGSQGDLDALLKMLKQHCGAGGSLEGNVLVIQGDHRERLQAKLESLGHRVKLAGG